MAKHNLFLGQARGKIGSVVFSRLNGVQVSRAYNPSPANPKSYGQATQRALFASISQYYKAFRYIIEQGQQGVKTGQPSIQDWQSRSLRTLKPLLGTSPMVLNAKGVQYPQLLPISLTNGSLPSLSYDIRGIRNSAGDTHYGLCLTFNSQYTTVETLAAMTLGDVYAMTPGLQRGFQLTFALLGWSIYLDMFDYYNRAFAPMWCQYVIAEDADETLPFFVDIEGSAGLVQINPAILTSSWGERFTPRWNIRVIDGIAVAYLDAPEYFTDGSGGIVAGTCITSYYDGSVWARSTSPMAIAADWATIDQTDVIATYQKASKNVASDLYLNQAKTKEVGEGDNKVTSSTATVYGQDGSLRGNFEMGNTLQSSADYSYPGNVTQVSIDLDFEEAFNGVINVSVEDDSTAALPDGYTVNGKGTTTINIDIPAFQVVGDDEGTVATLIVKVGQYTRILRYTRAED